MKKIGLFLGSVLLYLTVAAQTEQLAQQYFEAGEYDKASALYNELYSTQPYNTYYLEKLVNCRQQLQNYKEAEQALTTFIQKAKQQTNARNYQHLWVSLGYNYQLQKDSLKAKENYQQAFEFLKEFPNQSFSIAKKFEDYHLTDYALDSYLWITQAVPSANYYYQIAQLYAEKGNVEKMFDVYLDMMLKQNSDIVYIQRFMGRYLTEDNQNENNILLRKLLIKRIQGDPQPLWYKTLSWLYLQQKDYSKALIQEKALFEKLKQNTNGIMEVGILAFEEKDYQAAKDAFTYILSQPSTFNDKIQAIYYSLETLKKTETNNDIIQQEYEKYLTQYKDNSEATKILISYAQFLTFFKKQPETAVEVLEKAEKTTNDRFLKSEIKIMLADIYTYTSKFNQALVVYTQVQNDLKNHPLAETARYKIALTSYYKGDFDWANSQLKVLKNGTSKLIANDALDLSLLISDNIAQDSTHNALKRYAHAQLLAYQERSQEAIDSLGVILSLFKEHPIEDETLFLQAKLYEKQQNFVSAEQNYLRIIETHAQDILVDDAVYRLALLYDEKLLQPEKAKVYYEKIVTEHPSSYYLVAARKRFRELRKDNVVP